jgi:ADP-ribose pyrophosphatase
MSSKHLSHDFHDKLHQQLEERHSGSMLIHAGRFLTHRLDDIILPNGEPAKREVIEHPGGVVILPVLDDGRFVLVWQYRYAIGQVLLELPAGKLEKGEVPLVCAQRELEEETGYAAHDWLDWHYIHTAPGFTNERLYLFCARQLEALPNPKTEADEFIELGFYDQNQLLDFMKAGKLTDAKTLSALYYYQTQQH